jgi:phospholipase/lecithinase/hemolysin
LLFFPLKLFAFDHLVVFGDSLSDTGRIYKIFSDAHKIIPAIPVFPKSPPYYQGRFSNGLVWSENLAATMHVPLDNYAMGGSWVESFWQSGIPFPWSVDTLMDSYLMEHLLDKNKANHLYVIWGGGNDYLSDRRDVDRATSQTVSSIKRYMEKLVTFGATHIVVLNLPDLGAIPEARSHGVDFAAHLTMLTQMHNMKLTVVLADERRAHPKVSFLLVDSYAYMQSVLNDPAKFQLKNVKDACYTGSIKLSASSDLQAANEQMKTDIMQNPSLREAYQTSTSLDPQVCANPDDYLFWDGIHPTAAMHKLIAGRVEEVMKENKWM